MASATHKGADISASLPICFVISPIGDTGTDTRRRADLVFRHVIEPCASECGYIAIRADQLGEPGIITHQIIQHLIDDALVIADLTEHNANVFYELAIRHMLRKPLVQIIRRGDPVPFDVAAMRIIHVDHQDLDSVAEAKAEIVKQIRTGEREVSRIQSPISTAIDLRSLKSSERPEDQLLAGIAASVASLRAAVSDLSAQVRSQRGSGARDPGRLYEGKLTPEGDYVLVDVGSGELIKIKMPKGKQKSIFDSPTTAPDNLCECGSGMPSSECYHSEAEGSPS